MSWPTGSGWPPSTSWPGILSWPGAAAAAVNRIATRSAAQLTALAGHLGRRASLATVATAQVTSVTGTVSSGVYSPLDEGTGVLWLDLQDSGAFTESGGTLTGLTNKVTSTALTTVSGSPAYSATALNGGPCIDFDGTNDTVIGTEAAVVSALTNNPAFTLFYVAATDQADALKAIFGVGNSGVSSFSTRYFGQNTSSTGRWSMSSSDDSGSAASLLSTAATNTNPNVFEWWGDGSAISLSLNGAAADPNAAAYSPGALTPNRFAVGSRPDSSPDTFFDGKGGEWLLYSSQLDSSARSRVRQYLGTKWGITVTP